MNQRSNRTSGVSRVNASRGRP